MCAISSGGMINGPEESGRIAANPNGVGNVNDHVEAILRHGTRARLGASRREIL